MNENKIEKYVLWYSNTRQFYEPLAKKAEDIIREFLDSESINYVKVESRVKSIKSFENKLQNGINYDPKKMQDLAAVRVIGYVDSDLNEIIRCLKFLFDVNEKRSQDKSESLGSDKVGYRSIHLISKFSNARIKLPEYKRFDGFFFEIQIRTILQHAWAEILHDRNYKYSGVLPEKIKRKLNLLAGALESADNEFDDISKKIEKYIEEVSEKTKSGDLDIPINSISLKQFLIKKFGFIPCIMNAFGIDDKSELLINELKDMEINTLTDLNDIIPLQYEKFLKGCKHSTNFTGIIRDLLIINYKEEYFKYAWNGQWNGIECSTLKMLKEFGINIEEIIDKYNLTTLPDMDF